MASTDAPLVDADTPAAASAGAAGAAAQQQPRAQRRPKNSFSAMVTRPIAGLVSVITHGTNDREQAEKSMDRLSATPACMLCASFCIFVTVLVAGLLLLLSSEHFDYEAANCQVHQSHWLKDVDCCGTYKFDEKGNGICAGAKTKCNIAMWQVDYRLSGRTREQACIMSATTAADRVEKKLEQHTAGGGGEECFVLTSQKDACNADASIDLATATTAQRFTLLASNQDVVDDRQTLTWTRPQDHVAGIMLLVFAGFVFFCCIVLPAVVQDVPWCRRFKGELKMARETELDAATTAP